MAQNLVLNILARDKTKVALQGVRNGLNNLRKLQVSQSGFLKYEPFTGLLTWYEISSTIGDSPLGEAMDDFCGN